MIQSSILIGFERDGMTSNSRAVVMHNTVTHPTIRKQRTYCGFKIVLLMFCLIGKTMDYFLISGTFSVFNINLV